jgi:undecaprenyl diphosphate synthase
VTACKPGVELTRETLGRLISGEHDAEHRDVDLLIRSGGEKRLSDFLLWECAYAELFFSDRMWPDFGAEDLAAAVNDFRKRERRFGGVGPARKGRASVVCSATLAPKTFCSPECVI